MTQTWTQLIEQFGQQQVLGFFSVLARIAPLFIVAPLFSSKALPPRVKGIAAVGIAFGLTPIVTRGTDLPTDIVAIVGLIGKELLVGFAYAFVLSCLFAAITTAGTLLDFTIGFAFGATIDPISGNNSAVVAQLYMVAATAVFVTIGGIEWSIQGFARTYDIIGLADTPALEAMVRGAAESFSQIFTSALEICGPILIALLLTDAAFGMVSRVAPTLNVFAVGFAVKIGVGLVLIGLTFPYFATWLGDEMQVSVTEALKTLKVA